jgi:uncharacterized membrane protein YphA (DoxX/SURF4 family)
MASIVELSRRIDAWTAAHRSLGLDLIRVYLGFALFVRALLLLDDATSIEAYADRFNYLAAGFVTHYVVLAHLAGGLALGLGMATRLAAAIQIPALLGAVFIVHLREGLMTSSESLELAALVLFALLVLTVFGSGRLSLDHYVFGEPQSEPRSRGVRSVDEAVGHP